MKTQLLLALLLLFSVTVSAQLKTTIGFDFGPQAYIYNLYDEGDLLRNPLIPGGMYGFRLSQDISDRISVETGFCSFTYYGGPNLKDQDYYISATNVMITSQIPIRFKYTFPLFKQKLTISPHVGLINSFNRDFTRSSRGGSKYYHPNDTITVSYQDFTSFRKYFPLIETGIDFNVKLYEDLYFTFSTNYQSGLFKVIESEIKYHRNSEPDKNAALISTGDNFQFLLGFNNPVSNIWHKIPERKASKPERMKKLENSFNKRFYVGIDAGPIWRSFTSVPDKSIISAKYGRFGYFEYANLNLGFNAGMKIYKDLAFESGIYTQFYTNNLYFYINDSVEANGGYISGSTNLTEIPFTFKYGYHLPSFLKRFYIYPSLGCNILHTNAIGNYQNSTGWRDCGPYHSNDSLYVNNHYYRPVSNILTLNAGLGIEYYLFRNLIVTLNGQLGFGFNEFNKIEAEYIYHSTSYKGDLIFKGNSQRIMLGLKVPLDFRKGD